jgi:hypothetical protein
MEMDTAGMVTASIWEGAGRQNGEGDGKMEG